ncbi:MAG TPA: multicopper oxidase domain-containing protein, partial [Nocardioidaceae bacterium]|nr:multicopper oxidase domain-containing protein [Nocardioidaceae bacterium]
KVGGLGLVGAAGISGIGGFPFGGSVLARDAGDLDEDDLPTPFAAAFWRPPVLRPVNWEYDDSGRLVRQVYQVTARETAAKILPRHGPTVMWGYDGMVPGPTIKVARGVETVLRVRNKLPEQHPLFGHAFDLSTHLHGSASLPQYDGYADDLTHPHYYKDYYFPNWQPARTIWYHDHAVHYTAKNAYSGLAAQYHIHDRVERKLLPQGEFDVPLTITDALFDANGQLMYDDESQSGLYGDVILVNGRPWPTMKVKRRVYRFRILTASVSRSYRFQLGGGDPMHIVATDGGLVPRTQTVTQWRQSSAERYEVLIDFRNYRPGQRVVLGNLSNDNNRDYANTDKVMAFEVMGDVGAGEVDRSDPTWNRIPDTLTGSHVMGLSAAQAVKSRRLEFGRTGGEWTINDTTWSEVASSGFQKVVANPGLGDVEVWTLENKSGGWFHPVHIHLVDFRVLDRNGQPPEPWERGPKDTVYVGENETVRVVAQFGDRRRPKAQGRYMVHCHNLVHEDHDMMTQFAVGWKPGEVDDNDPIAAAPCQDDLLPPQVGVAPGRPEAPEAELDDGVVELDWDEPDDDGGTDITGYRVRAYAGGSVVANRLVGADEDLELRGLTPNRAYTFTVTAVNREGEGPQSPHSARVVVGDARTQGRRRRRGRPRARGRRPRPGARNVRRGRNIRVRFNEPVRRVNNRTVRVRRIGGRRVRARVTYNHRTERLRIDPRRPLARNSGYRVRLSSRIRDRSGNRLRPTTWRFWTGRRR